MYSITIHLHRIENILTNKNITCGIFRERRGPNTSCSRYVQLPSGIVLTASTAIDRITSDPDKAT